MQKRRWYQFILRSLLIGVTLLAGLCPVCIPVLRHWLERRDTAVLISPYLADDLFTNKTEEFKRVRRHDGRFARRRLFIHPQVSAPPIAVPVSVPGPPPPPYAAG